MSNAWDKGIESLQNRKYWEAHEDFEHIWRGFSKGTKKYHAMQALIQFCAACYKTKQVRQSGKTTQGMQRGMKALIERGHDNLSKVEASQGEYPRWNTGDLRVAFDRLEKIHQSWCSGEDRLSVAAKISSTTEKLVNQFST